MIRSVLTTDAPCICDIYNHYVNETTVSFEEEPVVVSDMKKRIEEIVSKLPYFVYELNGDVVGYAYATPWRMRSAYRFSVETSIYIKNDQRGKGIGLILYSHLIQALKEKDIHAVIGGVALPNPASIKLHEKLGFKKVAHFEKVGFKFDKWIDATYWEYIIEPL